MYTTEVGKLGLIKYNNKALYVKYVLLSVLCLLSGRHHKHLICNVNSSYGRLLYASIKYFQL